MRMKYDIPSTNGAFARCIKYTVCLGNEKDLAHPVAKFSLQWLSELEYILTETLGELNSILSNRGIDLCWYQDAGKTGDTGISFIGMYHITKAIQPKKVCVIIDGKTFKIDAEKLESLLKSLE